MNLQQKYNREDFLEFQRQFLPDFKKDLRPVNKNGLLVTKDVFLLGQSDQLDLQVFEFTHTSSTDARVSLAADGFRIMKNHAISHALAVYQSESSDDWRLSLMTATPEISEKGKVKQSFSNPRRYSFFLGPEAKIHTPEEFLIKKGKVKDAQDLISRFDVEIVTKEFFKSYKQLFENLQEFLSKDHAFTGFAEKNAIDIDVFAKKILGQIVFCYFLQKKGWLGASKGEDINKGDKDFMRSLFNKSINDCKNFYNHCLEHLFYGSLNKAPEEKGDFYRDYLGCQVPFLNGGLFEPLENYDWKKSFLHIPDTIFSNKQKTGVLDVFDLYNFTVYEDDPVDREVSVDPEMLGKVFENLLPENLRKGQGAYYTPREIVHYMCQESLINYLVTETGIDEKNIRKLIISKEHLFTSEKGLVFSPNETEKLDKALARIKVCDPACGSGAFLVGMLHEIVIARRMFNPKKNEYHFKKEAIQDSIYGVDIDPGAVEIAKLRLWLSLVVDYELEDIEPLPNLDYKIMCGNSLLEELIVGDEAIRLFDEKLLYTDREKGKAALFDENGLKGGKGSAREEQLQILLNKKQKEMLSLNNQGKLTPEIKRKLDKEITEILKELIPKKKAKATDYSPGLFTEKAEEYFDQLRELHKRYFSESDSGVKKQIRAQIEHIELEFIKNSVQERIEDIEVRIKNLNMQKPEDRKKHAELMKKKLEYMSIPGEIHRSKVRPYFLWKLNFFEVFQEKDGFDVVIANPPYVSYGLRGVQKMEADEKNILKNIFPYSAEYKISLYALFMDKAIQIARPNGGIQTFIVPDSFLLGRYFSKIRNLILKTNEIDNILLLPYGVFDATVGFSVIYLFQRRKTINPKHQIVTRITTNNELVQKRIFKSLPYQQCYFDSMKHKRFRLFFEKSTMDLVAKIERGTVELGEYMTGRTGVRSLIGQKNIISKEKRSKTWQKGLISGGQILKYKINYDEDYINIDPELLNKGGWDYDVIRNPKLLLRQTGDSLTAAIDYDGLYHLNNIHSFAPNTKELDILYLLAVINSKLFDFYYKNISLENDRAMAQTDIETLESLPIKKISDDAQKPYIDKVKSILKITETSEYPENANKQTQVYNYMTQLDQMIYKLYNLTDNEIKIVKGSSVNESDSDGAKPIKSKSRLEKARST